MAQFKAKLILNLNTYDKLRIRLQYSQKARASNFQTEANLISIC